MENIIESFAIEIAEIEKQLDMLNEKSQDLINNYSTKIKEMDVLDKYIIIKKYIDRYKNLLAEFDNVRYGISGYRESVEELAEYISFRAKYDNISDENLENIIDKSLTLKEKKELFKEFNGKEIVKTIKEIKQNWNKTFKNKSYKKVKETIRK